jgi:uncharacterized MnhB-related membrane protein
MKILQSLRDSGMLVAFAAVLLFVLLLMSGNALAERELLNNAGAGAILFLAWISLLAGVLYVWLFSPDAKKAAGMQARIRAR